MDRVWINDQEVEVLSTAFKDANTVFLGKVVYQTRGFVTQLPPGDYISYWESVDPVFGVNTGTVQLHILTGVELQLNPLSRAPATRARLNGSLSAGLVARGN